MASHGRGPIGRLLLGSVALKVLTYTTIPVQIVR
jgi:nucleotide-binding universal stress UspA family protein